MNTKADKNPRRPSLMGRLLLWLNLGLLLVLAAFLAWDYAFAWEALLQQKRKALSGEARTLLPAIVMMKEEGRAEVQRYIDEICAVMGTELSPGHHIAILVRTGDAVLQARSHGRASGQMLEALRQAAASPDATARTAEHLVVAARATRGETTIYVSEYMSDVRALVQGVLLRRAGGLAAAGLLLALMVHLLLSRLLGRPLQSMGRVVAAFREGELGARMPEMPTRDLALLAGEFNGMAQRIEQIEKERRRGMQKARKLQTHLQPAPPRLPGLDVACLLEPAADVAGDHYDVLSLPDNSVLFCMADVVGHGVPAAMGTAMLKTLLKQAVEEKASPRELMEALNSRFHEVALAEDYVTMILARWDPRDVSFEYAAAGHELCYLLRNEGSPRRLTRLESTGIVLGLLKEHKWESRRIEVEPGDQLLLLTDGVVETRGPDGELFGRERLQRVLSSSRCASSEELLGRVRRAIDNHRAEGLRTDDLAMLAVTFECAPAPAVTSESGSSRPHASEQGQTPAE